MKIYLIFSIICVTCFLLFVLFSLYKTTKYRKEALMILHFRLIWKLSFILSMVTLIIVTYNFPYSFLFIGIGLSASLMPFSWDVLITDDGIYFPPTLIPWNEIEEVSDHLFYLTITTKKRFRKRMFLKALWKIDESDTKRIESVKRDKTELN
jgi:hypothetical protein